MSVQLILAASAIVGCLAAQHDVVAPGRITDLAVVPFGGDGERVEFVCPGDDGFVGMSYQFQARYSEAGPIVSESDWKSATLLPQYTGWQELVRKGGQAVSLEMVQNPDEGRQKWLSVRFRDDSGNVAALSNSPSWDGN